MRLPRRQLQHGGRGSAFTLIELLVAVLLGLLMLAGLHRIFVAGLKTQNTTSLQSEANRKAQVAMDEMISRLRGASEVKDASENRIWFIDQEDNNCRYWLDGGTLYTYCGVAAGSCSISRAIFRSRVSGAAANACNVTSSGSSLPTACCRRAGHSSVSAAWPAARCCGSIGRIARP